MDIGYRIDLKVLNFDKCCEYPELVTPNILISIMRIMTNGVCWVIGDRNTYYDYLELSWIGFAEFPIW